MNEILASNNDTTAAATRPPPEVKRRSILATLFGDFVSSALTVVIAIVVLAAVPKILDWAVVRAVWDGDGAACSAGGACWAFLDEKMPLILFGIYPPDERWRPLILTLIVIALTLWSMPMRNWNRTTLAMWVIGIFVSLVLMRGGTLGLSPVPTSDWGGLPITLLLTLLSLAIGFPFAVALSLGRRSELPMIRLMCIGFIEIVRGLPLLSMLFIASVLLPIMLPEGVTIDNLFRALVALTFYSAAYLAEVLRGGLQGVSVGQPEAARSLGLSWVQTIRFVVLPQAIRNVIPPLTNTAVVIIKNTSLVMVVGLFDLLSAGRAALTDPHWPGPYAETFGFVALIYFVICFGMTRYSAFLERKLTQGDAR